MDTRIDHPKHHTGSLRQQAQDLHAIFTSNHGFISANEACFMSVLDLTSRSFLRPSGWGREGHYYYDDNPLWAV